MASPMSPSESTPITRGQINKFYDLLVAGLCKRLLQRELTQHVLETQGPALVAEFVESVRKRVDAISDMIVRHVKVVRTRSPQGMLNATGRNQYTAKGVVEAMPRGTGDDVEVIFFRVGRWLNDADLDQEYDLRGLKPADPFSLGAVNEVDSAFADEHPNGTRWKDATGKWRCACFDGLDGVRDVRVFSSVDGWGDRWWFAGVRK